MVTERFYLDKADPNPLHLEMTTDALTRPWSATKDFRRQHKVRRMHPIISQRPRGTARGCLAAFCRWSKFRGSARTMKTRTATWRSAVRNFVTAMMIVAMAAPAYAQMNNPNVNLFRDAKTPKTDVEIQKEQDRENGYKSGLSKIPDPKGKVDPWGNVRGATTPPPNKNPQQPSSK